MNRATWKTLGGAAALAAAVFCTSTHAQPVPRLVEVPAGLSESDTRRLAGQRQTLLADRAALKAKTEAHSARKVVAGSSDETTLRQKGAELRAEMQQHIAASKAYNDDTGRAEKGAKLREAIAADQQAIRSLGFDKRAEEWAEWDRLTEEVRTALEKETIGIILRLAVDEQAALVSRGVPAAAALDADGANRVIRALRNAGANDPFLADAIRALVKLADKAATEQERLQAATMLVTANQGLVAAVKAGTVLTSADQLKAGTQAILETAASAHGPQMRLLVGSIELTTELAVTVGQQLVIESRIQEMTRMTETQLDQLHFLTGRLKKHVRELQQLRPST